MNPTPTYQPQEPQRSGLMPALMIGALIALVAANIYLYVQIDHVRTDVASMQEKLTTQLSNLRDTSNVNTEAQKRHIETLKEELEAARALARNFVEPGEGGGSGACGPDGQAAADGAGQGAAADEQEISGVKSDVQQVASTANTKIAEVCDGRRDREEPGVRRRRPSCRRRFRT